MRAFLPLATLLSVGLVSLAVGQPAPQPALQPLPGRKPVRPGTDPALAQDQAAQDKKALEAISLKETDFDGMMKYLKSRTLTDVDLTKIGDLIKKLGDEDFETRNNAALELEKIGPPSIAPLRLAAKDDATSPESQYRSKDLLKRMEKVPHAEIAAACVRALAKAKKPEAVPVLLAYLPLSDSLSVSDAIGETLAEYAVVDGKPSKLLLDALEDKNALRRSAAGVALLGTGENKDVLKEVLPKVLAAAKAEKDPTAKFAMTYGALMVGRDKTALPMLLELLPDMNRPQVWQAEDLLQQLAGKDAPKARCIQGNKDSFAKAQKAWQEWWDKAKDKTDLAKAELTRRIQGRLLVLAINYQFNQGMLIEYDGEGKERNRITGLGYPMDIAFTPNGRMWTADQNNSTLTERDPAGKQLVARQVQIDFPGGGRQFTQPMGVQAMEDGGVMAICRNAVVIYNAKGDQTMKYVRPNNPNFGNHDVVGGVRMKNGEIALLVQNNGPQGQKPQVIFLDKEGKEIEKKVVKVPSLNYQGAIIESGDGKVMVTEANKVVEYDIATGKETTFAKSGLNNPRSLQKLPNGNVLVMYNYNPGTVIELTPDGEVAWTLNLGRELQNNGQVNRAYLR